MIRAERGLPGGVVESEAERVAVLEASLRRLEAENSAYRSEYGPLPDPKRLVRGENRAFAVTDERLIEAATGANDRREINERLGKAPLDNAILERRAERIGLTLPPKGKSPTTRRKRIRRSPLAESPA